MSGALAVSIPIYFDTSASQDTSEAYTEIIRSDTALLQVTTDKSTTCRYSLTSATPYGSMEHSFDFSFETLHKETLTGLNDGVYHYYLRCHNGTLVSPQKEISFSVSVPVSAQITFPDSDDFLREGLHDIILVTSKVVSEPPSLAYSYDGVSYKTIPLFGSGTQWNGYLTVSDSLKEAVGSFKFSGRDLEGVVGTKITSGGFYLVDTVSPETIVDVYASGIVGGVKIEWDALSDDIDSYIIYRSQTTPVTFADEYVTVDDTDYLDTSVRKGETYYYRVSAIDEAGNEGDLSPEVFATVLLSNVSTTSTGLESRLLGFVDSLLSEIDRLDDDIGRASASLEGSNGVVQELYTQLKLSRESNSAQSELVGLRREVEGYKLQRMDQTELDKKLSSSRLRLQAIKRKVPEQLIVVDEQTINHEKTSRDSLRSLSLLRQPDLEEKALADTVSSSETLMEETSYGLRTTAYVFDVLYLDGTRSERTLIAHEITYSVDPYNSSLVISVPQTVASSISDLDILNDDYTVLKENTVLGFEPLVNEIAYILNEHVDVGSIHSLKYGLITDSESSAQAQKSITGYFSLLNFESGSSYIGLLIGMCVVICLGAYLYFMKRSQHVNEELIVTRSLIEKIDAILSEGDVGEAHGLYEQLHTAYASLGDYAKKLVYPDIAQIHATLQERRLL